MPRKQKKTKKRYPRRCCLELLVLLCSLIKHEPSTQPPSPAIAFNHRPACPLGETLCGRCAIAMEHRDLPSCGTQSTPPHPPLLHHSRGTFSRSLALCWLAPTPSLPHSLIPSLPHSLTHTHKRKNAHACPLAACAISLDAVLCSRTSRRVIAMRIPPIVEAELMFMLTKVLFVPRSHTHALTHSRSHSRTHSNERTHVPMNLSRLLQLHDTQTTKHFKWFVARHLSSADAEPLVCDLIRFVCCNYHPTNEVRGKRKGERGRGEVVGCLHALFFLSVCSSSLESTPTLRAVCVSFPTFFVADPCMPLLNLNG